MKTKRQNIRFQALDAYRGFALILMAIYHFCFDLSQFGILQADMNSEAFWLNFRAIIMTSFLGLVGVSFCFARCEYKDNGFKKRLIKIGFCAVLISFVSYIMNPGTWIFFGVLHFIFLISLFSPWIVRFPKIDFTIGLGIILIPLFYRHIIFQHPALIITGLSPFKPMTEDFSPLFPWFGVLLIGVFIGYLVKKRKPLWAQKEIPFLSRLGTHSLIFYMTHQLVLYPLAWLISQMNK